jgi:hypothetical protein
MFGRVLCWRLRRAYFSIESGIKMPSEKILLAGAIVLNAFPVSAAAQHHRVTHVDRPIYSYVHRPIYNMAVPAAVSGGCPANGGPGCSTEGQSAPPDSW